MLGGVSPTTVKRTVPYFQEICVILGYLRELYSWLMLNDVKHLVNRQLQRGKTEASSIFAIVREAFL